MNDFNIKRRVLKIGKVFVEVICIMASYRNVIPVFLSNQRIMIRFPMNLKYLSLKRNRMREQGK